MANASKATTEARVHELLAIFLDGAQSWDAFQFIRTKEQEPESVFHVPEGGKPLSDAMIRKLITRAYKLMDGAFEKRRGKLLRRHTARLNHLFARASTNGELNIALGCLKHEAELLGLNRLDLLKRLESLEKRLDEMRLAAEKSRHVPDEKLRRLETLEKQLAARQAASNGHSEEVNPND
jgi:hypothetical protein